MAFGKIFNSPSAGRYGRLIPKWKIDPLCGFISREKAAIVISLLQLIISSIVGVLMVLHFIFFIVTVILGRPLTYIMIDHKSATNPPLFAALLFLTTVLYPWFAFMYYNLYKGIKEKDIKKISLWLKFLVCSIIFMILKGIYDEVKVWFGLFHYFVWTDLAILSFELYTLWIIYSYKTELQRIKSENEVDPEADGEKEEVDAQA